MNKLRWVWERVALYLPVLLMGLLAGATYWLVRSTPAIGIATPATEARHEPDYFMRKFSVKTFNAQGQLKSEVKGTEARHYPDTDMLEIDQVIIRSFDDEGHLTTATARTALSNGDGSEVTLKGDAKVLRAATVSASGKEQPTLTFRGEHLHAFINTEKVLSNQPVVLTRGQDQFTADSMDYDNKERVVQLDGRVKGVIYPGAKR